jgi:transposase
MGATGTVAPESKNETWPTCARTSATPQWHFMGAENRSTLARYARTVWQMDNHLQPFPALAQVSRLGQDVCRAADCVRRGEQCGLGNPFHRLHNGASPPARSGCKKSSAEQEALGRSRGGFSTKIHFRCEGTGRLITFLLTPGQESDIRQAEELMETGAIRRRSGQMRLRPQRLVADKGYTSQVFRTYLHKKHVRCTIARRSNERRRGSFEKSLYRKRNVIERLINRLKQFRRIATRYEKRAANFSAMITIASLFLFSDFAYRL